MHCHHEKTIVIDDRIAFVGGIDLTSDGGDRFDSGAHLWRGEIGWHDASAQIAGPAVADVAEHFRMRWQEVSGTEIEGPGTVAPAGDVELQIVRTVPEKIYTATPRGDFGILESYLRALRSAQRLIYLENQFLWSPEITVDPARQASEAAGRRLPAAARLAGQAGRRRRRHAGDARRARGSGRRRGSPARLCALLARRPARQTRLRARQDRHRRRRLADGRFRQPQRALALQRHRDERRHARRRAGPQHASSPLVRAPRAGERANRRRSGAGDRRPTGSRSARSSWSAARPVSH